MILLIHYKYKYGVSESIGHIEGKTLLHGACGGQTAVEKERDKANVNSKEKISQRERTRQHE